MGHLPKKPLIFSSLCCHHLHFSTQLLELHGLEPSLLTWKGKGWAQTSLYSWCKGRCWSFCKLGLPTHHLHCQRIPAGEQGCRISFSAPALCFVLYVQGIHICQSQKMSRSLSVLCCSEISPYCGMFQKIISTGFVEAWHHQTKREDFSELLEFVAAILCNQPRLWGGQSHFSSAVLPFSEGCHFSWQITPKITFSQISQDPFCVVEYVPAFQRRDPPHISDLTGTTCCGTAIPHLSPGYLQGPWVARLHFVWDAEIPGILSLS